MKLTVRHFFITNPQAVAFPALILLGLTMMHFSPRNSELWGAGLLFSGLSCFFLACVPPYARLRWTMLWVIAALAVLFTLLAVSSPAAILFQDDFEGSIRPEWQQWYPGDFTVTQDKAQHGSYSLSEAYRDRNLVYDIGDRYSNITAEGWFWDDPAISTYEVLYYVSTRPPTSSAYVLNAGVDTAFSTTNYLMYHGGGYTISNIQRSIGWHLVQLYSNEGTTSFFIDEQLIGTTSNNTPWRYFTAGMNGSSAKDPSIPGYWDNVRIYEGAPGYVFEPSPLLALGAGISTLATLKRRKSR